MLLIHLILCTSAELTFTPCCEWFGDLNHGCDCVLFVVLLSGNCCLEHPAYPCMLPPGIALKGMH